MRTIQAEKYNIYIGNELLSELNAFLKQKNYKSAFILVDENTKKHCLKSLKRASFIFPPVIISIKSSEKNKTIRTCEKIWNELSKHHADRQSLFINLGGGVISDIGGFCASTYKRGIDFVNIPTTLLSQVDASVGGKTGIDFNNFKNQIGTFTFPKAVFIIPGFLRTLNKRELVSGFAEVIKHGLIADRNYWKEIRSVKDLKNIGPEIISRSVEIKNKIVSADPFEKGQRKSLNFGHTIGHAIESALLKTKKPLLHGEAVAIGMICEGYLSRKYCGLPSKSLNEIISFIVPFFQLKEIGISEAKLIGLMKQDKKNKDSEINLTLLKEIGSVEINHTCTEELIDESIKFFNTLCQ